VKDRNYVSYLKLDQLLDLQEPASDPVQHDEMLFIVIHQVYELWFKLLLHELEKIKRDFSANDLYGAIQTFKRSRTVMKTLVGQLDILETMTPMSFSAFRDRLETSSGFQSVQFREMEFVLGMKRPDILLQFPQGSAGRGTLETRLREPSVVDCFYDFLQARGVVLPWDNRDRDFGQPTRPSEKIQRGLLRLYLKRPEVAILLELMTDFDEGIQEWRYRHVKLTERTIGNKRGTGGSAGVQYLRETLFKPIFPDLWAIRHQF
jgi:tryptophan 2,3-dioxygenase